MPKKTLVAYYSWSGTTARLAKQIQQQIPGSDILEITVPEGTFSSDMNQTADIAKEQIAKKDFPKLTNALPQLSNYDVILIGGPVWSGTPSTPLVSFLNSIQGFSGKIAPFYTDAGGFEVYEKNFKDLAGSLDVLPGLEGRQDITNWLKNIIS